MTDKVINNGISQTSFHDDGDDLIIAHSQNVTAIVDANKATILMYL